MTNNDSAVVTTKASFLATGTRLKAIVAATPLLGAAARSISRIPVVEGLRRRFGFRSSSSYWEQRYRQGGTSGSGSYGRLAEFKAKTINDFVQRMGIRTVIEFGCGDGAQLALSQYPSYVGIDVAESSIVACRQRFAGDGTKSFYLIGDMPKNPDRFDLVLSLDVIYHLVEDEIFESYMRSLFAKAGRFVAIYSSNKSEPSDAPHVRHRLFTQWIEIHEPEWRQSGFLPNIYPHNPARIEDTSFADFYFFERLIRY
jgi:cyclopropane fatty-acyl-phospholipid synthase-like methyltransferase